MAYLKAYTDKFGLITSDKVFNETDIVRMLSRLIDTCHVRKVYLTNGKKSKEILFIQRPFSARPTFYTRPDGIKIRTLSVHPSNYPLTAHFADGHTEIIK
jgi:hypothetical protein